MTLQRFEQLEVWRKAHALVLAIYRGTRSLPTSEQFGLIAQMRRSAVSVPANIAEGFGRRGQRDKVHFYNVAHSSLDELRYYCLLCRDLEYAIDVATLFSLEEEVGRMLNGLVEAVGRRTSRT